MQSVLVTGADRGLGLALCAEMLRRGFMVFGGRYLSDWPDLDELAAQFPEKMYPVALDVTSLPSVQAAASFVREKVGRLDMLINNAGIAGGVGQFSEAMDFTKADMVFNVNSLGPLRVTESFLPLMQDGMKRLCFVSSEAGSITASFRTDNFAYTMSKTALNMGIRRLHNHLYPQGFTFRVYHPGWLRSYMSGKKSVNAAVEPADSAVIAANQFISSHGHEDVLEMLDNENIAWSF